MHAGLSETIITPPVGGWLLGPIAPSTGVHDDLYARALVLDDGTQRWAMLCLDIIGLTLAVNDDLCASIRQQTGIETILINCSHTHSSPFSIPWSGGGWERYCREERGWQDGLYTALPHLVREATERMTPVSLRAGRAPVQIGVNRRLMKDNHIVMAPNPNGPVVPWVDVLQVNDKQDHPMAVLYSHAAHPVIVHATSTLISADYPGAAVTRIRRELGEDVLPLFAQGCSGNINGHPLQGGHAKAEEAGNTLGEAVLEALRTSVPLKSSAFKIASRTVLLPCQPLPSADACGQIIDEVKQELAASEETDPWYLQERLQCLSELREMIDKNEAPQVRFEMTAVMLGNEWGLLAMPHEVFSDYALWADDVSPFTHTMTCAYTNGCEIYVPTDQDLELGERGGYEAACFPAPGAALVYRNRLALRPGIEGQIKETASELWKR